MTREEHQYKVLGYRVKLENLRLEFHKHCYLSLPELYKLYPNGSKVKILSTNRSDPYKLTGKIGEIDLTFNVYSESWINVKFPADEDNPEPYRRLIDYERIELIG